MLGCFKKLCESRSPAEVIVIGFVLAGLVGTLDHFTGYELSFSIFYLLPIALVVWYAQRWAGFVLCGFSAGMWLVVDYTAGHSYSHWLVSVWNAVVRLGLFLVTAHLLGEIRTRLRREEILARTDGLTQILNAHAFKEVSDKLLQLAARHHHPTVVAYIDIDNFKEVNDQEGHSAGDRALQTVASVLAQCVRSTDVVARLGGDEFAVLMPETDYAGAQIAFAKIHEELVRGSTERGFPIGFSIGVAVFPKVPCSIDEALKVADHLMYRVKKAGKNNVIYEEQACVAEKET